MKCLNFWSMKRKSGAKSLKTICYMPILQQRKKKYCGVQVKHWGKFLLYGWSTVLLDWTQERMLQFVSSKVIECKPVANLINNLRS